MARPLTELFPWPFVGVVLLLLVLILLTPYLLSAGGGPAAGSIETQAELIVDRTMNNPTLHVYVEGLGIVRYASLSLAWSVGFAWPPPGTLAGGNWTNRSWANDSLSLGGTTQADPVAVNVSAIYVDATGNTVWYTGLYAFHVANGVLYTADLTPGASAVSPTALTNLPLAFPLTGSSQGGTA